MIVLEKPDINDYDIISCLQEQYELPVTKIVFLPLGADFNTAVYRAIASDSTAYFVKIRRDNFDEISVDVPQFLYNHGIKEIICPLVSRTHTLSVMLNTSYVVVYPFVDGKNGWDMPPTSLQWHAFGRALHKIHNTSFPITLAERIAHEDYSPRFRNAVRAFQSLIERKAFTEPSAAAFAALLMEKKSVVDHCIARAEELAAVLQTSHVAHVLCHSDIHQGNLLINSAQSVFIVDWDQPIFAPKECDLMFISGGVGGMVLTPEEEDARFYAGYGPTEINVEALAYYRYERIVKDLAAYGEMLLLSNDGGQDRLNSMKEILAQFLPGNVVDMAYRTEQLLRV